MATPALVAMRKVTGTIPIVFVNVSDPVDGGFVASMAHPGGNVTGFTSFEYSLGGKWLQILQEVSPGLARVMVLLNRNNYTSRGLLRTIEGAAPSVGLSIVASHVKEAADIEPAITGFAAESNGGMIVLPDPATTVPIVQIISLALLHRLPAVHTFRFFPAQGGLMSYGPDDIDIYRRAGQYVARILRGDNVWELPVQNPTRYQLVVNLKCTGQTRTKSAQLSRSGRNHGQAPLLSVLTSFSKQGAGTLSFKRRNIGFRLAENGWNCSSNWYLILGEPYLLLTRKILVGQVWRMPLGRLQTPSGSNSC